jgi:hypothetical protein
MGLRGWPTRACGEIKTSLGVGSSRSVPSQPLLSTDASLLEAGRAGLGRRGRIPAPRPRVPAPTRPRRVARRPRPARPASQRTLRASL